MRFGLTPWSFADRSAIALSEQAAFAESLGYRSFWLPENHFNPNAIPDPLMLLAAVAAATSTIRLATTSFLLPLRHPLLAAEQVAVLDRLSRGRVLLGVGRGYSHPALRALGVAPASKRARFERVLALMIKAWSGAPVAVDGTAEAVVLDPLPVQQPHPPIWVAAFGPKALAQAGRLGLPYLASPIETQGELLDNFARHDAAVAAAGHERLRDRPLMRTIFVCDDARVIGELRDRLARAPNATGSRPRAAVDEWAVIGDRAFVRDKLQEYEETIAPTELVVTRLRLDGVDEALLRNSVATLAQLL